MGYYFGKRYYDPELMRWLTPDPAGFADGMNLYAYVWNNPLKYFDPDGQFAFVIAIPLLWSAAEISAAIGWSVATVAIAWGGYELSKSVNQWADNRAYKQSELEQQSGQATLEDNEDQTYEVYAPDRPLPRDDKTKEPKPDTDAPHTQLGTRTSKKTREKYPQAREFDENGKPVRDIDFTDHRRAHEHPNPHQHRYIENPTGGSLKRDVPEPLPGWRD